VRYTVEMLWFVATVELTVLKTNVEVVTVVTTVVTDWPSPVGIEITASKAAKTSREETSSLLDKGPNHWHKSKTDASLQRIETSCSQREQRLRVFSLAECADAWQMDDLPANLNVEALTQSRISSSRRTGESVQRVNCSYC
jgi:hypothetical protein